MPCPRQIYVSLELFEFINKNKQKGETYDGVLKRLIESKK